MHEFKDCAKALEKAHPTRARKITLFLQLQLDLTVSSTVPAAPNTSGSDTITSIWLIMEAVNT
jgi:hypothetical protein